jgi:threonine/homoserine/homoserine lactone efflux protein
MPSIEFLLTALVVVLLPGTGVIYTLAVGLGRGFSASIAAAFGCTFGIVPAAVASIIGLAAIFHTSALAFQIIKYLGVAYLMFMAWSILREGGTLDVKENKDPVSHAKIAMHGIVINILNPKLSLFFLAFLPQFVSTSSANPTLELISLATIFMVMTFVVFILYGGFAALVRDALISKPAIMVWMKRGFAGAFASLGLKLALSER